MKMIQSRRFLSNPLAFLHFWIPVLTFALAGTWESYAGLTPKEGATSNPVNSSGALQLSEDAKKFKLVADLVKHGRAYGDADALAYAATILGEFRCRETDRKPITMDSSDAEQSKGSGKPSMSFHDIVADAEALCSTPSCEMLLMRANAVWEENKRGRVGDAAMSEEVILANNELRYTHEFEGGEVARVFIMGDGDTNLDLRVFDENSNLIGSDLGESDACCVEWKPSWTGEFTISVTNEGDQYNRFVIFTD